MSEYVLGSITLVTDETQTFSFDSNVGTVTLFAATSDLKALFSGVGDCYTSSYQISKDPGVQTSFSSSDIAYKALFLSSRSNDTIHYNTDLSAFTVKL